jgi:hypothetical protein
MMMMMMMLTMMMMMMMMMMMTMMNMNIDNGVPGSNWGVLFEQGGGGLAGRHLPAPERNGLRDLVPG